MRDFLIIQKPNLLTSNINMYRT